MKTNPPDPQMQPQLAFLLRGVARHLRAARLHKRGLRRWGVVAFVAFVLLEAHNLVPAFAPYTLWALGLVLLAGIIRSVQVARADKLDFAEAARAVEESYPDLKQALRTAAEQQPGEGGRFNYLQNRVIASALKHANLNNWRQQPQNRARWHFAAYGAVLALALALTLGPALLELEHKTFPVPQISLPKYGVTVTPGNKDIERGDSVVIAARFDGRIPHDAQLVWRQPDGKTGTVAMARSLSDPIFAFTLPVVNNDVTYSVKYNDSSSEDFTLKVFDQPALLKADATLDYPTYTGLPKKTIPDTRRVSAITGTKLQYDFTMNKPMKDVKLTDDKGAPITVTAANADRTRFTMNLTIAQTQHLTMHLTDNDDRPNPAPTDLRITAVATERPVVMITFPVRDQHVSPLEEIHLQGTARDQFGLLDYGIAYSVGAQDPQYISLRGTGNTTSGNATAANQAAFGNVLDLEAKNIDVGELVTWFAWADDHGPDGKVRRTTSDLAFAEVRPFEMIFHEDDTAGSQQQQQQQQQQQGQNSGNPAAQQLLQLEQQISVAIWNLKQQDAPPSTFKDDIATLKQSQDAAIAQLPDAAGEAQSAAQKAAAVDAGKFMKQADDGIATAGDKGALDPLTSAWSGAQGAYQALLKMQAREFRVAQQQSRGGQSQQQRNPMQDQLDQLQFRNQQNRYQSENTAQDPASQQQRNQMEAQSRLSDLARRQQDLNQRLQEMQTALNAAQNQQQKDEVQRELQRLQEEQKNMLADLDQASQNVDQMQSGQQTQQARQQLDQARNSMRQASDQLAQNQVSQALASGTRADQSLQQTKENLQRDTASQFATQMQDARQQARDLANQQQADGQQLEQLAQNGSQSLDDTAKRQALAQSYTQQAQNLDKLTNQLQQIAQDSEDTEPALNKQLYDLLRQQSQLPTADDLKNSAQLVNNGLVSQTRPLQTSAAQNLDQLRAGVERAAQSVIGDDTAALRFAQNELTDLTQQLAKDQPADSQQFRDAGQAPPTGQNGTPAAGSQNNPNGQPGAQAGQRGQNGQNNNGNGSDQLAQDNTSNAFRDAGANPGQSGQQGQGQPGQNGQRGQGQDGQQTAQNGQGQQGNVGQRQGNGQRGSAGQDQNGGQGGEQQMAQNGQGGRQGNGGQRGQNGQGGRGQNGGQPGGQETAQNGQGGRQGNGGQRGQGGQGGTDQNGNQVAQDDNAVDQPFDQNQPANDAGAQGGRAGQGGQRAGGQGGNRAGGNRAGGGGAGQLAQQLGGNGGGGFNNQGGVDNARGPITGTNYADWANRLRTVQNLIDDPQLRQQVANALAQADDLRRNYVRHSQSPQWNLVMDNVMSPLSKVSTALQQQLAHIDQPDSLQPVDQDPVPEKYADSVKKYYEALGN